MHFTGTKLLYTYSNVGRMSAPLVLLLCLITFVQPSASYTMYGQMRATRGDQMAVMDRLMRAGSRADVDFWTLVNDSIKRSPIFTKMGARWSRRRAVDKNCFFSPIQCVLSSR